MQPCPVGQPSAGVFVPGPQGGKSLSHIGGGTPLSVPPSGGAQSAGIVGLPMQISQRSHGFEHWVTCVQVGHLAGLPKSAAVQVDASLIGVGAPGTRQQPKQSQPFGTNLRQKLMHDCDCDADVEHSIVCDVAYSGCTGTSC